jgi:DNA polymerase-3 subunit alpha
MKADCSCAQVGDQRDGDWVKVGGMITESKKIRTRTGSQMMFATVDDLEGAVEIVVFEKALSNVESALGADEIVLVRGRVDHKEEGEIKLVAQEVEAFEPTPEEVLEALESAPEPIVRRLTIQVDPGVPASFLDDLRDVVRNHRGDHELLLAVGETRLLLGPDWRVSADGKCCAELNDLAGTARLVA